MHKALMTAALTAATLCVPASALAQAGPPGPPPPPPGGPMMGGPGEMGGRWHHDPMASLNLSADQQAKMKAIHDSYRAKMQPLFDQMKALHDQERGEIRAVLTPAQQKQLDDQMQRMHRRGGMDGPGPAPTASPR